MSKPAPLVCQKHGIPLVCFCPACAGSVRTPRKSAAAADNIRNVKRKLDEKQVHQIREDLAGGATLKSVAKRIFAKSGVRLSLGAVWKIKTRRTWPNVT